jgi:hypothetical protein
MNEQADPQQPTETTVKQPVSAQFRLRPPEYDEAPVIYANFAQATISQHDLTLFLGWFATPVLTAPPTEPVDVPVRPLAAVSLPIGLLPALIQVLNAQVGAWEQSHGQKLPPPPPIPQPPADESSNE